MAESVAMPGYNEAMRRAQVALEIHAKGYADGLADSVINKPEDLAVLDWLTAKHIYIEDNPNGPTDD